MDIQQKFSKLNKACEQIKTHYSRLILSGNCRAGLDYIYL